MEKMRTVNDKMLRGLRRERDGRGGGGRGSKGAGATCHNVGGSL